MCCDADIFKGHQKVAVISACLLPRVQTWSRLQGTVAGDRSYLYYDRPSTLSSNAPAFRGQSRLSGFCCANGLCVRSLCHHNSRMRTFDENSCAISITSPRSLFRSPGPNKFGGITGRSPSERPHYGIAGGKSRLPGKVPANGT